MTYARARAWSQELRPQVANQVPPLFNPPPSGGAFYSTGYRWRQVLHYKFWSFCAIRAWIKEIAGGAPPNLGRIVPRKGRKGPKGLKRKALGGPQEHEEFEPYPPDHPLQRLFRNPNGPDVAYDHWAYHTLFLKLTGEAHWWVIKNEFGVPVELWVIPTQWLRLETGRNGEPVSYYAQSPWGQAWRIPYADVVSFYEHGPLNPRYEGYAVSQAIAEWLDTYDSLVRTRFANFKNQGVPALWIKVAGNYDEAMLNRLYARWHARFQGENKAGQPFISNEDILEVTPIGNSPAEMGYQDSEDQSRDMTLAAYDVPKGILGLEPISDTSNYAPQRVFCRFSVNPFLNYCGQVVTEKIIKPVDPIGALFWDDRVIDDPAQLLNELASRRQGFSITPNEERALFGAESYPLSGNNPVLPDGTELPWVEPVKGDRDLDGAFDRLLGRQRFEEPSDGRQFGDQAPPPAGVNGTNGRP